MGLEFLVLLESKRRCIYNIIQLCFRVGLKIHISVRQPQKDEVYSEWCIKMTCNVGSGVAASCWQCESSRPKLLVAQFSPYPWDRLCWCIHNPNWIDEGTAKVFSNTGCSFFCTLSNIRMADMWVQLFVKFNKEEFTWLQTEN